MISPEQVPLYLNELSRYFTVYGEAQVIDYSRRTHYGPWVKLRIEHGEQLSGFEPGQRYQLLMVRLEDSEMPVSNQERPYRLSQKAGMLCSQEDFRHFITSTYGIPCHNVDQAAQWVREACNVPSRSLLDSDDTAGETFRGIMAAFDEWKRNADGG